MAVILIQMEGLSLLMCRESLWEKQETRELAIEAHGPHGGSLVMHVKKYWT